MAAQSLLTRTCSFLSKSMFNNRPTHVIVQNSVAGIKTDTLERLKQLQIPEKPKKPLSPYIQFVSKQRIELIHKNPNLKQSEIVKKCADEWKNISEEIKKKYNETYKTEIEEYNKHILNFNSQLSHEQKEAIKAADREKREDRKKRRLNKIYKDTNRPKRPLAPYSLFVLEQSKIRNISLKDSMLNSKEEWKNLKDDEKQKYHKRFEQEREKYNVAMEQWEKKMVAEGHEKLIRAKSSDAEDHGSARVLKKKTLPTKDEE